MLAGTGRQSRASRSVIWPFSQEFHLLKFGQIILVFLEFSQIFSRNLKFSRDLFFQKIRTFYQISSASKPVENPSETEVYYEFDTYLPLLIVSDRVESLSGPAGLQCPQRIPPAPSHSAPHYGLPIRESSL